MEKTNVKKDPSEPLIKFQQKTPMHLIHHTKVEKKKKKIIFSKELNITLKKSHVTLPKETPLSKMEKIPKKIPFIEPPTKKINTLKPKASQSSLQKTGKKKESVVIPRLIKVELERKSSSHDKLVVTLKKATRVDSNVY